MAARVADVASDDGVICAGTVLIRLIEDRGSMSRLDQQVVIITGASAGIGEATARRVAREGAIVVINARRLDRLEGLKRDIEAAGGRALAVAGDITNEQDRARLV